MSYPNFGTKDYIWSSWYQREVLMFEINRYWSMWGLYFQYKKRVSFLKIGRPPKAGKLELVYMDVWGSSQEPSLGSSLCYVTFIDDSIRKVLVFFLKKKYGVYVVFKKLKMLIECGTSLEGKATQVFDKGGQYREQRLKEIYATSGVKLEIAIPRKPKKME